MEVLHTPDERFENLPGYPWAPRYTEVDGLRVHHVEEGPAGADPARRDPGRGGAVSLLNCRSARLTPSALPPRS